MGVILNKINSLADLKAMSESELQDLASEIREVLIRTVSQTGGHLAPSLGVVELTIALHRVFDSPEDKIIWDVGHQCYAHKLLTGRKDRFATIRQHKGLSGFTSREESVHDPFGAGHAGTSISAALGMAVARDLDKKKYQAVAVIGDGSLGTGMAFESINHAGHLGKKLIVVLNDNDMSISSNIGALSRVLNRIRYHPRYESLKREMRKIVTTRLSSGDRTWIKAKRIKNQFGRLLLSNSAFWEQLGFIYLGPVDGHNIEELEVALARARDFETKPTLLHVYTVKGKGFPEAEANPTKFHGISSGNPQQGKAPSYSKIFAQTVLRLMQENEKIVAITPAMLEGSGLSAVAAEFPDRVFDVGICEQHAVTLAAGLAAQGFIPIVAIYSTFLQRAYDQIIHDVCLQNLPVVLAVDRAGIVGDDGKTHQGIFDLSYLRCIPNLVIASPKDENEFQQLLFTAVKAGQPVAVRYPRGQGEGTPLESAFRQLPIGRGEMLRDGQDLAILAIGTTVYPSVSAAEQLASEGIDCAVANVRFIKPLDSELILNLAGKTKQLLTAEENASCGGFNSAVLELLAKAKLTDVRVESLSLPDKFIEHGSQELLRAKFNLDAEGLVRVIRNFFPKKTYKTSDI